MVHRGQHLMKIVPDKITLLKELVDDQKDIKSILWEVNRGIRAANQERLRDREIIQGLIAENRELRAKLESMKNGQSEQESAGSGKSKTKTGNSKEADDRNVDNEEWTFADQIMNEALKDHAYLSTEQYQPSTIYRPHAIGKTYGDGRGHYYTCSRLTPKKRHLICVEHKNPSYKCTCRASMFLSPPNSPIFQHSEHTHPPHVRNYAATADFRARLRERARTESTPFRTIYEEEIERYPSAKNKVSYKLMVRSMLHSRKRAKQIASIKISNSEAERTQPAEPQIGGSDHSKSTIVPIVPHESMDLDTALNYLLTKIE